MHVAGSLISVIWLTRAQQILRICRFVQTICSVAGAFYQAEKEQKKINPFQHFGRARIDDLWIFMRRRLRLNECSGSYSVTQAVTETMAITVCVTSCSFSRPVTRPTCLWVAVIPCHLDKSQIDCRLFMLSTYICWVQYNFRCALPELQLGHLWPYLRMLLTADIIYVHCVFFYPPLNSDFRLSVVGRSLLILCFVVSILTAVRLNPSFHETFFKELMAVAAVALLKMEKSVRSDRCETIIWGACTWESFIKPVLRFACRRTFCAAECQGLLMKLWDPRRRLQLSLSLALWHQNIIVAGNSRWSVKKLMKLLESI